jgi:hypothetical protein
LYRRSRYAGKTLFQISDAPVWSTTGAASIASLSPDQRNNGGKMFGDSANRPGTEKVPYQSRRTVNLH